LVISGLSFLTAIALCIHHRHAMHAQV
jgi:hypothetical protein